MTASAGSEVDLMQSNVRFPQTQRESIGYDRDLGNGWVGTVEECSRRTSTTSSTRTSRSPARRAFDPNGRVMYGLVPNGPVLKVTGAQPRARGREHQQGLGLQLDRRRAAQVPRQLRVRGVVHARRGEDVAGSDVEHAGVADAVRPRMGRATCIDQIIGTSLFQQDHRIVVSRTYRFQPTLTDISLIYSGRSGNHLRLRLRRRQRRPERRRLHGERPRLHPQEHDRFQPGVPRPARLHDHGAGSGRAGEVHRRPEVPSQPAGTIMQRNSCQAPWIH